MNKKCSFEQKLNSSFCHKFQISSNEQFFCRKCLLGPTFKITKIKKMFSPFEQFFCGKYLSGLTFNRTKISQKIFSPFEQFFCGK